MENWNENQQKTLMRKMKHERLCKHIQKASKFEFDDPKDKQFWRTSIEELEQEARKSAKCGRIKIIDLSTVLPEELRGRVEKIIPVANLDTLPDDDDDYGQDYIDEYAAAVQKSSDELSLDPVMLERITEDQMEYDDDQLNVKIDEKSEARKPSVFAANWMADYFKKPNTERIVWQTKLYKSMQRFEDKSLFEQVEELTHLSAVSFVQWLNELGQDKSDVTEDMVKKLFSIGIEEDISRALKFGSSYVEAVSDNVADYWNLEQKGIKKSIKTATETERAYRGFTNFEQPDVIPQVFKDIRTFEGIFKGITNLTSVQLLVDYLKENPHIEKPQYLLDLGMLDGKKKD